MKQPILYSFRRCPYAIRARMALYYSNIAFDIYEVNLRNKPKILYDLSPKGTVPVLQTSEGVIDESMEIIHYALNLNDPMEWLSSDPKVIEENKTLIDHNDNRFKYHLDRYKYPNRYPHELRATHQQEVLDSMIALEQKLNVGQFLLGQHIQIADVALFPFIRQAANVDITWFEEQDLPHLKHWLHYWLSSQWFIEAMHPNTQK